MSKMQELQVNISYSKRRKLVPNKQIKTLKFILSTRPFTESVKSVKLLGIILDEKLTWKNHVESLSKKFSNTIFLIRQLKSAVTLGSVYSALFHSNLS